MTKRQVMTVENLLQSLETIADEEEPNERLRKRRKKRYRRAYHAGLLHFDWTHSNALQAYKLCIAEQINGRYHWTGWECRGNANWAMATIEFPLPRWDGSDCKLLVLAEQGLGDEILFASCFPDLLKKCPRASIECDPRLTPLFERSFDAKFITRWNAEGKAKEWQDYKSAKGYDMFCPAGELPKIFRRKREDFTGEAYLIPGNAFLPEKTYGISWEGRQGAIDPSDFNLQNKKLINLQYHMETPSYPPFQEMVFPDMDVTNDIDDVFNLVAALDAVITVPNTLAHIGGSLGVRTHVVRPDPVYAGEREDEPEFHNRLRWEFGLFNGRTPWYKSVRTYRSLREFRARMRQIPQPGGKHEP